MVRRNLIAVLMGLAIGVSPVKAEASLAVTQPVCEYQVNPIGIGVILPLLS